ncbi:MAG: outer membrane beta-barrel protein [Dysgonamonadaceae bacterium]|jgi:hypothetical protein|nr:outer membrane beta-barrel protein [Dysgonamonadaceae bacterium]
MKKVLFLICLLSLTASGFAQEEEKSNILFDGSSYNFFFSWKKKPAESHWSGLAFAFSNLNGLDKENVGLKLNRSYSIDLNLMDYNVPLHYHWLFVTGLGFDWSRYHFKGNVALRDDDNGISRFLPDSEGRSYRDSKLLVYYATIPLLLEYQKKVGKHKTFFINGGVEGLLNLYSKSQVEARTPDGIKKMSYKDLNILPVNFRLVLRTGFDNFSIFGYYQPYSMFQKGKGPEVRSFGIGIALH